MLESPWERATSNDLDAALEQYGRSVTPSRPSPFGRWAAYAAAGGSGLALAESAQAAIVYSGPQNIAVAISGLSTSNSSSAPINLNGAGAEFNIRAGYFVECAHYFVELANPAAGCRSCATPAAT